jgi:conserved oligomeric Golgi complex subunit 6
MESLYNPSSDGFNSSEFSQPLSPSVDLSSSKRVNALTAKLANVLSSSYADSEIREALRLLDLQRRRNDEAFRRNLKFESQKEVIDANAHIVKDFGKVAEVSKNTLPDGTSANFHSN